MTHEEFYVVFNEQIKKCEDVLIAKGKEYAANDDRLFNFKQVAKLNQVDAMEALWGMCSKQIVSIADFIKTNSIYPRPLEVWDEKITDVINYLILLRAILREN